MHKIIVKVKLHEGGFSQRGKGPPAPRMNPCFCICGVPHVHTILEATVVTNLHNEGTCNQRSLCEFGNPSAVCVAGLKWRRRPICLLQPPATVLEYCSTVHACLSEPLWSGGGCLDK